MFVLRSTYDKKIHQHILELEAVRHEIAEAIKREGVYRARIAHLESEVDRLAELVRLSVTMNAVPVPPTDLETREGIDKEIEIVSNTPTFTKNARRGRTRRITQLRDQKQSMMEGTKSS